MDVFSRTFFPAAAAAGVAVPPTGRHMSVFRQCVEADDSAVLLTRCLRPHRSTAGEFLLLLTNRRLVVTQQSRVLHRLSLHLNANLRHLSHVTWAADRDQAGGFEVAATAVDGVRERFWMNLGDHDRVRQVESLFQRVFTGLSAARQQRLEAVAA
jgi:hypothetical protein